MDPRNEVIVTGEASADVITIGLVSKESLGLGDVDNTSDANKPVSAGQQAALNLKVNLADVVDNLTTVSATRPLSAKQGQVLKGLVDNLTALLQSNDTGLDQLQEVVDYIKVNRATLQALSIPSIAGLQAALDLKASIAYVDGLITTSSTADRDRANHTGTQPASSISDFNTAVAANATVAANTAARHTHANKALLDTYDQTNANIADAVAKKHAHANQAVLDDTTAAFKTADRTKLDGVQAGAQVNNLSDLQATDLTDGGDSSLHRHDTDRARANHTGTQSADTLTDGTTNKAFTAAERTKLAGVATGATTNATDAQLRDRTTHTGVQAISTVTGLQTALDGKQPLNSDLTTIAGLAPLNDDLLQRKAGAWINRTPAQVKADLALTKVDVGLGNVDNTSDANKPVSTAQAAADNTRVAKAGDTMAGALNLNQNALSNASAISIKGTGNTNALSWPDGGSNGMHVDANGNTYLGGSGGSVYIRPNGRNAGTNQSNFDASGNLNIPAQLRAAALRVTTAATNGYILTSDSAGNATWQANAALAARAATVTVGRSGADFIAPGTNDGAQILAAINALPASGGKIIIRNSNTPYDFSALTDRLLINKSNVVLEAETPGGVTFKANASLFPGGSNAQGQFGILTIGRTQTGRIGNIFIRGITFDLNHQLKTAAVCVHGSASLVGQIGIQGVYFDHVTVKNGGQDDSDPLRGSFYVASGVNQAVGNCGYVDKIEFTNCDFGQAAAHNLYFQGGNITNVLIDNTYIHDNGRDGIIFFCYDDVPTCSDWTLRRVRFERNMILTSINSQAHFRDESQAGIYNLTVDDCYFGPTQNPSTRQDYCLTPYWAANLKITNCIFDRTGSGISIGASMAGSYSKIFPISRFQFHGNIFYQSRSIWDPDSAIFGQFTDNIFYEVKTLRVFGSYSRHFPTVIAGNIIYDCHTSDDGENTDDYNYSAIQTAADGFSIHDNYFIDDRALPNPTVSLSLTQVAGGALPARTYYVRHTWANDTGETLGSTQQTLAVAANSLLQTNYSSSLMPSGAKKLNVYVSTTSGSGWTLQGSIDLPTRSFVWTEPTTGIVAGASLPIINTTTTRTRYWIYELEGGANDTYANIYSNNHFIGLPPANCIREVASYRRLRKGNTCDYAGSATFLEVELPTMLAQSSPPTPSEGSAVQWTAAAAGTKDGIAYEAGDVLMTSIVGGVSKTKLLMDYSAA